MLPRKHAIFCVGSKLNLIYVVYSNELCLNARLRLHTTESRFENAPATMSLKTVVAFLFVLVTLVLGQNSTTRNFPSPHLLSMCKSSLIPQSPSGLCHHKHTKRCKFELPPFFEFGFSLEILILCLRVCKLGPCDR
jgi:hypothetical protein